MLFDWCTDKLTVIRPATKTERGATVHDWAHATEHVITGCSAQPAQSSRDFAEREEQSTFMIHVFMPPDADIRDGDRIRLDMGAGAQIYEINGVPYRRTSPTGRVSSTQVDLVKWEG